MKDKELPASMFFCFISRKH